MLDVAARPAPTPVRTGSRDHDEAADPAGEDDGSGQSDQPPPHAAHGSPTLTITGLSDGASSLDDTWIVNALTRAMDVLQLTAGSVRIEVVDDARMTQLHRQYCDLDSTTDVLTFDLNDGTTPDTMEIDVDIVVCVDEAGRQAAGRGHRIEAELVLYGLHGLLHCLGYDDHDEADFAAMHAREDEVLEAIGIGAIFRDSAAPTEKDSDPSRGSTDSEA